MRPNIVELRDNTPIPVSVSAYDINYFDSKRPASCEPSAFFRCLPKIEEREQNWLDYTMDSSLKSNCPSCRFIIEFNSITKGQKRRQLDIQKCAHSLFGQPERY